MSATDPLQTVWDGLEREGCEPHGDAHRFRAHCPLCRGESDSLAVGFGADGRALLWCFRCQGPGPMIAAAVGVQAYELFPAAHPRGNPFLRLPEALSTPPSERNQA